MIVPLLPSCCSFSFVLDCGVSFFGGTQQSPVNGCSAASCDFGVLTEEDECRSFYSTLLKKKNVGISELKWARKGEFNSDDHYFYYCGQEYLRRNGAILINNKRVQNAILGCSLKNNGMISVHFQDKSFNITLIQAYAATTNGREAEAN